MSVNEPDTDHKPFDLFELVTAILLGLTAVGAAMASLQSGQWGGKQLDAFSSSNSLTTKAANQYNEDTVAINADYAAVAAAKEHILEARDAEGQARERHLDIASYQYSNQMSELGYKSMGLPMDYYIEDEEDKEAEAAAPAAAANPAEAKPAEPATADDATADDATADDATAKDTEDDDPETTAATALERDIPDEVLFASLTQELDDDYIDKALETGTKMFEDADKKFEEGRQANDNGDKFDLAGVIYTVGLFFAGLGLVFKTKIRWGFFAAGAAIFVGATIFLMTLPWA